MDYKFKCKIIKFLEENVESFCHLWLGKKNFLATTPKEQSIKEKKFLIYKNFCSLDDTRK